MSVLASPGSQAPHHGAPLFKDPRNIIVPLPTGLCKEEQVMLRGASGILVMRVTQAPSLIQYFLLSLPQVLIQYSHT